MEKGTNRSDENINGKGWAGMAAAGIAGRGKHVQRPQAVHHGGRGGRGGTDDVPGGRICFGFRFTHVYPGWVSGALEEPSNEGASNS